MKKILFNIVCFLLIFCCLGVTIFAEDSGAISPRFNNTVSTNTSFFIESGIAYVNVGFTGFSGVTTGGQITTKIQKRFLLVFWSDVDGADWVDNVSGVYYSNGHSISVKSGYYRAQVEYTIYGSGGAADIIAEQIEAEN